MIKSLWNFFFGKDLGAILNETKIVRVCGARFKIRKVNVTDYLSGSKILLQSYETYKTGLESTPLDVGSEKRIKEHYADVLIAGVVTPRLVKTAESELLGEGIHIEKLFIDWDMITGIYNEIMLLSYGKKKVRQFQSQEAKLSK